MNAYENICTRRSVRKFNGKQVSKEILEKIVYAGQCAASAMNRQPTAMVVVQDKDTIAKLSKMNAAVMNVDMDPFYGCDSVIIVFGNPEISRTYIQDGSLVMGNLMNAANALGVASCWIHRAKEVFESEEGKEMMREWGIEESFVGIGNCILGYCDENPSMALRTTKVVWK